MGLARAKSEALDKSYSLLKQNIKSYKGRYTRGILLPRHAPGAKLLRVYQRFHGYTSSSGAEFPPRKMLHDI